MRAAAELELATPKHSVTPAPTLPADELLGDLLVERGKPEQALAAYQRSLELHPNRLNSLLGAARAARDLGGAETARGFYAAMAQMGAANSDRAELNEISNLMNAAAR